MMNFLHPIHNDLSEFSAQSKLWVYYGNSAFEGQSAQSEVNLFVESWKSHGSEVKARGYVILNQIILLVAEENSETSGCSIDSSVRFVKSLGEKLSVDFFERNIYTLSKETHITKYDLAEIQSIDINSLVFNPFFKDLTDWKQNFIQKLSESKYKRMI